MPPRFRLAASVFLAVAATLISAGVVASTAWMVWDAFIPVPIEDQWVQLVGERHVTLAWLWSQHNEHRLLIPRLVFVLDRVLAHETGALSLSISLAVQLTTCAVFVAVGPGWRSLRTCSGVVSAALIVALGMWSVQYANQTWAFQVQFTSVSLATLVCLASAAAPVPSAGRLVVTLVSGAAAAVTLANGLAALPLAVCVALWTRQPRPHIAILSSASVALAAVYLIDYQTPPEHGDPLQTAGNPAAIVTYVLAYLGAPWAEALRTLIGQPQIEFSVVVGAVGLIAYAASCLGLARGRRPSAAVALAAMGGFALATALVTALGRLPFGIDAALTSRYATPAIAFWTSLGLLAARRPALARMALPVAATVLLVVAVTQPRFATLARIESADRSLGIPALVAGVADAMLLGPIYPDADVPLAQRLTMFGTRTGPFAWPWASWIGTRLTDHVRLDGPCAGRFDRATPIDDPNYPGWRVEGQLDGARHAVIVLTDPVGTIAGFGLPLGLATLAWGGPAGPPASGRWVGATAGTSPDRTTAYVLDKHLVRACRITSDPVITYPLELVRGPAAPPGTPAGGAVDSVLVQDVVTLDGWALLQLGQLAPRLMVDTDLPIRSMTIREIARPDAAAAFHDPRLMTSGFHLVLEPRTEGAVPGHLCLWSSDPVFGVRRLVFNRSAGPDFCPD